MLTPFLNILFLHLLLFDLSLKWPRPFLSHGGPSFSLCHLLEFLIPQKLLIPLLYKLTHHIVTVHRRTHHLLLVLTLPRSNYFIFLLELVSIGCNVRELFLGVVLNVLEVLLHHMLVDILRLVDLLLLIQKTLIQLLLIVVSLHLIHQFLELKWPLRLYDPLLLLIDVIFFLYRVSIQTESLHTEAWSTNCLLLIIAPY